MGAQSSTGVWFVQVCIRTSITEYQASFLHLVWAQDRCDWGDLWVSPDGRMPMQSIDPSGHTGNGLGHIWASRGMGIGSAQHFLFCLLTFLPFGNYPFLYFHDTGGTTIQPSPRIATMSHRGTHVTQASPQENSIVPESGKGACLGLMTQVEHITVFLWGWYRSHAAPQGASFLSLERFGRKI